MTQSDAINWAMDRIEKAFTGPTCPDCKGVGTVERTIGGDGYDNRCCAEADVTYVCSDCEGTGKQPVFTDAQGRRYAYEPSPSDPPITQEDICDYCDVITGREYLHSCKGDCLKRRYCDDCVETHREDCESCDKSWGMDVDREKEAWE